MRAKAAPKHAAPGGFSTARTVVLPGLLLTAAGGAFAAMAVLPAAATDVPQRVTAAQALAPVELAAAAPVANSHLATVLDKGLQAAASPKPQPTRAPARASRSRQQPKTTAGSQSATVTDAGYVRPGEGRRTSGFGRRWGRLHAGVDLAAGVGSPVRAVTRGTVISARSESGYGRCVRIRHSDGTVTVYAHMSALLVEAGEKVSAGEQIGREGNTGRSTGPHLHFEVRINGTPINPAAWLRQRGVTV